MRISLLLIAELCLAMSVASADDQAMPSKPKREPSRITPEHSEFFEARIRPILTEHCVSCHGPKKQQAGLRLDSQAGMQKGAESGPVVVPGRPEDSPLIDAIRHDSTIKMPPKSKLPDQAIFDLTTWVQMARTLAKRYRSTRTRWGRGRRYDNLRSRAGSLGVSDNQRCSSSSSQGYRLARTPIDRFILARLEAKALSPSPQASRLTLIRRATFDLTGLPPTPEDLQTFEADNTPGSYDRLIDRLLASPRYGERWGRYWLDVRGTPIRKVIFCFRRPIFTGPLPIAIMSSAPSTAISPTTDS